MRVPILTIERVVPFFWVLLGLREADAFRVLVVEDFDGVAVENQDDFALILRDSGDWIGC
ncbi:MAG: hypothetical protein L0Z46_10420 [Nitrospiraceae bacterium]|nr:hypothetical protein [Nitrospiraceae bacterium]